jgi:hypothetical protein
MSECPHGKRGYPSYGDALAALVELDSREGRTDRGSVYECRCGAWHVSKRLFTLTKARGRDKRRRGVVA